MEKIIFGASALGQIAHQILKKKSQDSEVGIYDDGIPSNFFTGKVLGKFQDLLTIEKKSQYKVFVAIGNNSTRQRLSIALQEAGFSLFNIIDSSAIIEDICSVGSGNLIMANSYIGTSVKVGDGNIVFPGACITHHNVIGGYNFFGPNSCIGGFTSVGNTCKIGINSAVAPYITLGDDTQIQPLSLYS
jgi:sugar O-acyltransferase (sialic acid O-acetyltransferase NeuD family)